MAVRRVTMGRAIRTGGATLAALGLAAALSSASAQEGPEVRGLAELDLSAPDADCPAASPLKVLTITHNSPTDQFLVTPDRENRVLSGALAAADGEGGALYPLQDGAAGETFKVVVRTPDGDQVFDDPVEGAPTARQEVFALADSLSAADFKPIIRRADGDVVGIDPFGAGDHTGASLFTVVTDPTGGYTVRQSDSDGPTRLSNGAGGELPVSLRFAANGEACEVGETLTGGAVRSGQSSGAFGTDNASLCATVPESARRTAPGAYSARAELLFDAD